MDTNQVDDLKDFLTTLIGQTETRLETKIETELGLVRSELGDKIDIVHQEMLDGFEGVGEAIIAIHERIDKQDARLVAAGI